MLQEVLGVRILLGVRDQSLGSLVMLGVCDLSAGMTLLILYTADSVFQRSLVAFLADFCGWLWEERVKGSDLIGWPRLRSRATNNVR